MSSVRINLHSLEDTQTLGQYLGQVLTENTVLLLQGDLGAGKTTLVQGIGQGLGITDAIVSPTFALIHEYLEGRIPLYHMDLYRLSATETDALHLETYWTEGEVTSGIVAIEWPDRLSQWPDHYLSLQLDYSESGRQAHLTAHPLTEQQHEWIEKLHNRLFSQFELA
ncbi:MAG TPA: tRNA (adenosine(37)-N6)-threonylcarbamoyltransferase complex ATPase subunit type 1 TsaE [Stenomitos sp.]